MTNRGTSARNWQIVVPCCFAVLMLLSSPVFAQDETLPRENLTADQIAAKMAEHSRATSETLLRYTCTRIYEADYKGLGMDKRATMTVEMTYSHGKKSFRVIKEEGSGLIRNHVLKKALEAEVEAADEKSRRENSMTLENYVFTLQGMEAIKGRPAYVLAVKPKHRSKFVVDGTIWVDAKDFALVRAQGEPAKSPSFWITHPKLEYEFDRVGGFWLPIANQSESRIRIGGNADFRISYLDYSIEETSQSSSETTGDTTGSTSLDRP